MSIFANDRDLLAYAPTIFRDAGWLGQRLFRGVVTVAGTTLTAQPDVNFAALGVGVGGVVVIGGASYEITGVIGPARLIVSRPRASEYDPPIAPSPAAGAEAVVWTLRPQMAVVEAGLMRECDLDSPPANAWKILNPRGATALVCVRTVLLALGLAGDGTARAGWELERYRFFERLERGARGALTFLLDKNGDGQAEEIRTVGALRMVRD